MINRKTIRNIPLRTSLTTFFAVFLAIVLVMACTDLQQHNSVFDEEELNLMTDFDETGKRGYHEITIFMEDEEQADRHDHALSQLDELGAGHIISMSVYKGENAVEEFGQRGADGVVVIHTDPDPESYNAVLQALGMEPISPSELPPPAEPAFTVVEKMPELIGGLASIQKTIQYPEMARRAGIEGNVYIQFIVNEEGQVESPRVIRGIGGGCDEEALRAVRQAEFEPGMQRGQPVRVQYSLPIAFKLDGNDSDQDLETGDESTSALHVIGYE